MKRLSISLCLLLVPLSAPAAGDFIEQAPIHYSKSKADTPLTRIADRIAKGEKLLSKGSDREILNELLTLLEIPPESQVLVYSKTSAQNSRISPKTPRAIFFSDNTYLGWVKGGNIEVMTFDEKLGAVFHMVHLIDRLPGEAPRMTRDQNCLTCHAGPATGGFPGVLARSVYPSEDGQPIFHAGSFRIDHSSPIEKRWGGWYVTGDAGERPHLGNATFVEGEEKDVVIRPIHDGPVDDLSRFVDCSGYPGGASSDVVALMVLEHQLAVHNALVEGNLTVRRTFHQHRAMQKALEEPLNAPLSETGQRILAHQSEKIVKALLFAEEFILEDGGVEGSEKFQAAFLRNAKECMDGRTLKDFRLYERLFKHRCSYLIHSDAFQHLPKRLKKLVLDQMHGILTKPEDWPDYDYLAESEREKILQILSETLADWPGGT